MAFWWSMSSIRPPGSFARMPLAWRFKSKAAPGFCLPRRAQHASLTPRVAARRRRRKFMSVRVDGWKFCRSFSFPIAARGTGKPPALRWMRAESFAFWKRWRRGACPRGRFLRSRNWTGERKFSMEGSSSSGSDSFFPLTIKASEPSLPFRLIPMWRLSSSSPDAWMSTPPAGRRSILYLDREPGLAPADSSPAGG